MLKNYVKELSVIGLIFGLISYTVYVCAAEPVKAKPAAVKKAEPAKKVAKPAEAKKEHAKKPKLKAKYADKK